MNLINDGENFYRYDSANRLISVNGLPASAGFTYNGLGDRMTQTVNSETTIYTLDLNAGLTQGLSDGTNTYLYGNGRIAQENTATDYYLGDARGSVRQMTDGSEAVTYAASYTPYGEVLSETGTSQTNVGYTGEMTDPTGMVVLRARYYSPYLGRFTTKDTWEGSDQQPISTGRWCSRCRLGATVSAPTTTGFSSGAVTRILTTYPFGHLFRSR